MGKINSHYKMIILFAFLFMLVFSGESGEAAVQEDELFEKAYESYLSYRPEKALEYFNIFLENFPESSARDAVLFWKAKSLMQLKKTDEALKIFYDLKRALPGSPFVPFIEKELLLYQNNPSQSVVKKEAAEIRPEK